MSMANKFVWLKKRYGNRYDYTLLHFTSNEKANTLGHVYYVANSYHVRGKTSVKYFKRPSDGIKWVEDSHNLIGVKIMTEKEIIKNIRGH